MITSWVLAPGMAAAAIALPAGIALEHAVATAVVNAQTSRLSQVAPPGGAGRASPRLASGSDDQRVVGAGQGRTRSITRLGTHGRQAIPGDNGMSSQSLGLPNAYNPGTLALVILAGLGIATIGALLPASWAAASKATTALQAE
jgi:hypothetical protein